MARYGYKWHDLQSTTWTKVDEDTHVHVSSPIASEDVIFAGDVRPRGINGIAHETVRTKYARRERLVVTLLPGRAGGVSQCCHKLLGVAKRYKFTVHCTDDPLVWTLTHLNKSSIAYLCSKVGVWIEVIERTPIRLDSNGPTRHLCRKPKPKRERVKNDKLIGCSRPRPHIINIY